MEKKNVLLWKERTREIEREKEMSNEIEIRETPQVESSFSEERNE